MLFFDWFYVLKAFFLALPTVNCSDIPAGPVNYTGSCHGNMFHYVWEARNDVGGEAKLLKDSGISVGLKI